MLLISTVLADLFHRARRGRSVYVAASATLLAMGVLASLVFPLSKNRVSLSYVLISVAISALVFLAFDVFSRRFSLRLPLLRWWGRNPLLLYVIHILLLVAQLLPGSQTWYAGAPLWSAFAQFAAEFAVMSLIAWRLDRAGAHPRRADLDDRDKAPGSAGPDQGGVVRERPGEQVVTAGLGQSVEGIGKLGRAKVTPSGDGLLDEAYGGVLPFPQSGWTIRLGNSPS